MFQRSSTMSDNISTEDYSSDGDGDGDGNGDVPIVRQQAVFIMDKIIMAFVSAEAAHVRDWIHEVEFDNHNNRLRLIVGIDIKLGAPEPPIMATSAPPYRPIALLVLYVYRSCLIFEIDFANKIPTSLSRFLSDRGNNTLVGVGLQSKLVQLEDEFGLGGGARYVDLGNLAAERYNRPELNDVGVGELRTFLHGSDVERPPVVDVWDDEDLSFEHARRACIDAYTCYELGSYLVYPLRRGTPDK